MGPPRRGDVHLCELDPTVGSETRKTRPVLVVSPDEINDHMRSCGDSLHPLQPRF